jgi:hypothetical protein
MKINWKGEYYVTTIREYLSEFFLKCKYPGCDNWVIFIQANDVITRLNLCTDFI